MSSFVLKACFPLLLLASVVSGCSEEPSLMRLDCLDSKTVRRDVVFDRHTGQLFHLDRVREVYVPTPVDRFTVKRQGVIQGKDLVIQTRVGEWKTLGGRKLLKPLHPPVGDDFRVNVTTLSSTYTPLMGSRPGPVSGSAPVYGQCKSVALYPSWVDQAILAQRPSGS